MSHFSNRDYIQSLTASALPRSSRPVILAAVTIAGVAIVSIGMWVHYRRQVEFLKKQNEILLAKLEAANLQLPNPETEMDKNNTELEQTT